MTNSPRSATWSAPIALAAFVALAFVAHSAGAPPDPRPIDADPTRFSAERARASLARILDDETPHPVGSAAHASVVERVVDEFRAIGVEARVRDELTAGRNGVVTRVRNVVATIPGRRAGPSIAIAAHHDSVAAGPGASDDGAGVAAAIECVRALRAGEPLEHPLVVLITDGEEVDLSGAGAFVRTDPTAADVRAVVNLEARGTDGLAYLFQTGPGVGPAIAEYGALAERPSTSSIAALVYDKLPNDTDLTVFLGAGWTGLNFAFIGGVRRYHTPLDDLAHLDARSLQHLGDGAMAGLRALDRVDLAAPHAERGERVWHDVLGRFVIGWPRGWSAPLALAALASLFLAARRRVHATSHSARGAMATGAAAAALAVVAAALATWGFAAAQSSLHEARDPWFAAIDAWHAAGLVVAAFATALATCWSRVRAADALDLWFGGWIAFAATGVVVACVEPAACLLFVAPSLGAAVACWLARADERAVASARTTAIAVATSAVLAAIWLPFLAGVELALGFAAGFVPGALAGTAAASLSPLAARASRGAVLACAIAVAGEFAWLARLPDRTIDAPIPTNTMHVQTDDAAHWAVVTYGAPLPAGARAEDWKNERLLPWMRWFPTTAVAAAPRHDRPAPRARVTAADAGDGSRRLRVALSSPRGASTFALGFPADAVEVVAIRSGGLKVARPPSGSPLSFVGIGPEGVEVEFVERRRGGWTFDLADAEHALPLASPFARDPLRVPRGRGDVSVVATMFAP